MPKAVDLPLLSVDRSATRSLQQQVIEALRHAIAAGHIPARTRLPATRVLGRQLGVSRNTVLNAFEQLVAEGYARGRPGSGTYIADDLPDPRLRAAVPSRRPHETGAPAASGRHLQRIRHAPYLDTSSPALYRPLCPAIPSVTDFPLDQWEALRRRLLRTASARLLEYAAPQGHAPLRQAIAEHWRDYRGVACDAGQVVITGGAQSGFHLALAVLAPAGAHVWMEDPGYSGFRGAAIAAGCRLVHRPIDAEGLVLAPERGVRPPAAAYVTPSRQFPLGVTMSLRRRMALLDWAERVCSWIIEDDYDSEHRYAGRPLPALQGLRAGARVVYVGTFSKTLYPALRLGFLIAPASLVPDLVRVRAVTDAFSPTIDQAVLAEFISGGHYARHLRRMQSLYGERLDVLCAEFEKHLAGVVRLDRPTSGLCAVGWLPGGADDRKWCARAAAEEITAVPLSHYAADHPVPPAALFGFAAFPPGAIRRAVGRLARIWS